MRTKKLLVFFFIVLSFSYCKKDDEISVDAPLLVGVKSGNVNIYNANCSVGNISIDLNNDSKFDINFWTSGITAPSGHSYSSGLTLLDSSFQVSITLDSISPEINNFNDTIDKIIRWSYLSKKNSKTFILVEDYYVWTIQSFYNYSYWLNKKGFICLRKEDEKGKFKYGWIKIEVESYNSFKVLEYAFMK